MFDQSATDELLTVARPASCVRSGTGARALAETLSADDLPRPVARRRVLSKAYAAATWEDSAGPLVHCVKLLRREAWKVGAFVATAVIASVIVTERLTPLYEATATLDLGRQVPSAVVGNNDGALPAGLDLGDRFLPTQMKLIQSDAVLRPVAERFNLLDGAAGADRDAPVALKHLKVTRPPNSYLLQISYRASDPRLAASVVNEVADSYLKQTYTLRAQSLTDLSGFMAGQIDELRIKMERSGAALAEYERELDIIDPEQKSGILSARLMALNEEHADAQADRVRKESVFRVVAGGSLVSAEISPHGELLRNLLAQLEAAQHRFTLSKTHYGSDHPEYRKTAAEVDELRRRISETRSRVAEQVEVEYRQALTREQMLQSTVAQTKGEFDRLNARSFEYQRLRREAESDRQLYEELARRIKEAGINAGFQDSAIRVADRGRPPKNPVFPNLPLNVFLALLSASMLAVGVVLGRDYLASSIQDAGQVEEMFGVQVLANVPAVKLRDLPMLTRLGPPREAASRKPTAYEEAVRALHYAVLHSQHTAGSRSLLVTSGEPDEGKTTISLQLAVAHAASGQKTLLIETDSRAAIHPSGTAAAGRLAHVLRGELDWRDAVLPSPALPHLHLLPAGASFGQALHCLDRNLARFLASASREYDLIVIDSPPLLGFVESLEMATVVDGVLVVACAEKTTRRSLGAVLQKLGRSGANVVGVALNRARPEFDMAAYYGGYRDA